LSFINIPPSNKKSRKLISEIILANYDLIIKDLQLIEGQFCKMYSMNTNKGKYFIKTYPLEEEGIKNEGYVTDYLLNNGINVPQMLMTKNGNYHVETAEYQFHVQQFIEGEILALNTAPELFFEKSVNILGQIHNILKDYKGKLKPVLGNHFLDKSAINYLKDHYIGRLYEETKQDDKMLIISLEERVRNLERVSAFVIDENKLTYSNSHGDFHIGQLITDGENLTVIDWTSAGRTPICFEVIRSYVYAASECKNGVIIL